MPDALSALPRLGADALGPCIGCDPAKSMVDMAFLLFRVWTGAAWSSASVCIRCAAKLTAEDVHLLAMGRESAGEEQPEEAEAQS